MHRLVLRLVRCIACTLLAGVAWVGSAQAQTVRVGVYNNAPKIFWDGDQPKGLFIDIVNAIARAEGWTLTYVACEWQACLDGVREGRIDLMPDVAYTAERDAVFDFPVTPVLHSWSQVYSRSDKPIVSVLDLQNRRVAMLDGGVQVDAFKTMVSGFGLTVQIQPERAFDAAFAAVESGRADAAVSNNWYGQYNAGRFGLVESPVVFLPSRLHIVAAQGKHADWLAAIDRHLRQWQGDNGSVYFEILREWRSKTEMAATPLRVWVTLGGVGLLALLALAVVLWQGRQLLLRNRRLRHEHARMQAILDAMPDLLFELDLDGRYIDVHAPRSDLLAAPSSDLLGRTVSEVLPADAAQVVLDALRQAQDAGYSSGMTFALTLPQDTRWFELSVARKVQDHAGERPHFIMLSRDVTQSQQTQQALRAGEDTYRALFEASPVPLLVYRSDRSVMRVNTAFGRVFGYDQAELTSLDEWQRLVYPDPAYRDQVLLTWTEHNLQAHAKGTAFEPMLVRIRAKDGRDRQVRVSKVGIGELRLAVLDDVTEISQAHDEMQQMRQMMERTEQFTRTGSWQWDLDSGDIIWSRQQFALFGLDPAQGEPDYAGLARLYTPESMERLNQAVQAALKDGTPYALELTTLLPDGTQRSCMVRGFAIKDSSGKVVRLHGLSQDITDLKAQAYRQTLALNVFTHAREGIVVADPGGSIVDCNASFSRITGYAREELLGRNPRMLSSGHQSPTFYREMWRTLLTQGFWEGELWNRRKDGTEFAEHLTLSPVRDEHGVLQNYVGIVSDVTALHEHRRQLEHVAYHDRLTGLPNRVLLADRLQMAMTQCARRDQSLAVAYLDLDGFKAINDTHGHATGDQVLVALAERMRQALREGDTLSRFGGDEFVVVLPDVGRGEGLDQVLRRLLQAAAEPVLVDDQPLQVSASIGVTVYPQDHADADQLLRHADQAMYLAKQSGKNRFQFFDVEQAEAVQSRMGEIAALLAAIQADELCLYFQPLVDARSGSVLGVEALIRWQHPQRGLLAPAQFLPVIEGHLASVDLGEWVIHAALRQMAQWLTQGLILPVSVNIGALQLQQERFPDRLRQALAAHPTVPADLLKLEVLETSALLDLDLVSRQMHACMAQGVVFALDDFGTGYSSLAHLRKLPVQQLKIDRNFVRDMMVDPEDMAIVEGIIGLARVFGREVVAEGVETPVHAQRLVALGCPWVQGYGIARPMPAASVLPWIEQWRSQAGDAVTAAQAGPGGIV